MKLIKASIVTIGDEILYGHITDTNSQWISAALDAIGIKVLQKLSIGDQTDAILKMLDTTLSESDLIVVTGGLGPTNDDITKKSLAQYFQVPIVRFPEVYTQLEGYFLSRNKEFNLLNQTQADLPSNCDVLINTRGTAPGMWIAHLGKIIISLPGVPYEMKGIMTDVGLPKLKAYFKTPIIQHKLIKTGGIGESTLAMMIDSWEKQLPESISLAYLPSAGEVKLRLTAIGEDAHQVKKVIDNEVQKLLPIIEPHVYGMDDDTWESSIARWLLEHNYTIAGAESCTGGYVSHLLTTIPGSSSYFKGSIIAYSNEVKQAFLGITSEQLDTHGAVSASVVETMAQAIQKRLNTTFGYATSGIAGPGGGSDEKPVGTVWIAVATATQVYSQKLQLTSMRDVNIRMSALAVFKLLRKQFQ